MRLLFYLIRAEAKEQAGRLALGGMAIFASVCLIVWMMGSYDSLVKEFDHDASAYMGRYDLCVSPLGEGKDIPYSLVGEMRSDSLVEGADMFCQIKLPVGVNGRGEKTFDDYVRERMGIPSQSPMLVGCMVSLCPYELKQGRWPDMRLETKSVGVLGSASADFFKVGIGDLLSVRSGANVFEVEIVGIVEQSQAHPDIGSELTQGKGPAFASLFVPWKWFESVSGRRFSPNLVSIVLKEGVSRDAFLARWNRRLKEKGTCFAGTEDVRLRLENNRSVRRMKESAQSAIGMVLFSSVFIIFATLSMSVRQRASRFALLRTIGTGRGTIAGLVVGESLLLSIPALIGGLAAGWLLLNMFNGSSGRVELSLSVIGTASGCAVLGSLLACIIPAWKASRSSPVEALAEAYETDSPRFCRHGVIKWSIIGAAAWLILPAVLLIPGLDGETRKFLFFRLGYPGLAIGVLCLAPACVIAAETWFSGFLARVMRLHPRLMKMQFSSHFDQSVGTTICLTAGLGLFMAVQIWGYSMLVPFVPDQTMPGMLVSVLHSEVKPEETEEFLRSAGLDSGRIFPVKVEEPDIAESQLSSEQFKTIEQKSIVLAGIPLACMMEGENPPLSPRFIMGDKEEAIRKLKRGKALLIPDTFSTATGLKPGDFLSLVNESRNANEESWEIAGVVSMPGWHWITKTSGMRVRRGHFVAALAIADDSQVSHAYGLQKNRFFWGRAPEKTDVKLIQKRLEKWLRERSGQDSGSASLQPMVKVTFSTELNKRVSRMGDRSIEAMSALPLVALGIASLAVMNAVAASVRSRRRYYGVMRAIGATRWCIVRLVWAESLLLGGSAVLLSFLFALLAAWGSIEILAYGYFFGGVTPPLLLPWLHLGAGVLLSLLLCWLASMAGVFMVARRTIPELMDETE